MSGAGHIDPSNKKIALLIAVLALVLAFSETLGNGAQTKALSANIEASNLWSFFQAKTIRMTTVRTAAEQATLELPKAEGGQKEAMEKQIKAWRDAGARYDSEPDTNEGRKELMVRAKKSESDRDRALAQQIQLIGAHGMGHVLEEDEDRFGLGEDPGRQPMEGDPRDDRDAEVDIRRKMRLDQRRKLLRPHDVRAPLQEHRTTPTTAPPPIEARPPCHDPYLQPRRRHRSIVLRSVTAHWA